MLLYFLFIFQMSIYFVNFISVLSLVFLYIYQVKQNENENCDN